jgi:periplasmic protein TonB
MLGTLLESNAPRHRHRASTVASIVVHTAVIAGAIVVTASARTEPTLTNSSGEQPFYVPLPDQERRIQGARSQARRLSGQGSIETRVPIDPRTIDYSVNALPPVRTEVDPGQLLAGDTAALGPPLGLIRGERVGRITGDQPATVATVDRVAAMLAPLRPRYPDQLRAAGVTGRVVVRLVVDTMGRVEPASVVIRESSHDLFAQAVRAVLPSLRFVPAEAGGRKVRMLVDLPFEFRLNE